jgi:cysteinyl-tRNA synthetase
MNDDLNTPRALKSMIQLADDIQSAASEHRDIARAQSLLLNQSAIFGLGLAGGQAEQRVIDGWNRHRQNFVD